jgi:hypothetical protein
MRVSVHLVDVDDRSRLVEEVARCAPVAIYLAEGVKPDAEILQLATRHRALTVAAGREAAESGATLAFVLKGDRVGLAVNRTSAEREQVRFDAALLRMADVLD